MSEWETLTGWRLKKYVAERWGWKVVEYEQTNPKDYHRVGYWLQYPDGTLWGVDAKRGFHTPINRWSPDEFYQDDDAVPDFLNDPRAALALWPVEGCYLGIECFDDEWTLAAYAAPRSKEVYVPAVYAESFTDRAALAYHVTRAWCAVINAKEGVE